MRKLRLALTGTAILALLAAAPMAVVAQEDEADPGPAAYVQGSFVEPSSCCGDEVEAYDDGGNRLTLRGMVASGALEMDDPRISGAWEVTVSIDEFPQLGTAERVEVHWGEFTITNADGSWIGTWKSTYDSSKLPEEFDLMLYELTGTGAYEGLSALLAPTGNSEDGSLGGAIFPSPLPPRSETAVAAEPAEEPEEAAIAETIGEPADSGARFIEIDELDERTVDLTIDSPAVGTEKVRLLLPAGFAPDGDDGWPVLYLLHGAFDDYTSWTRETDVADLTADLGLLVVMPEAGEWGFYSDWWNGGEGGPPLWETFHLTEVRELLERNYQAGEDRVVAGLSMGGFGTMSYAARHPELFEAAASFSGVLHPLDPTWELGPDLWGSKTEQSDIWEAHDPVLLAAALEGIPLYVSYGNGEPGPLDAADAESDDLEAQLSGMNEAFVARLGEFDIPATVDAYGAGTHTWPYWERGLHEAMPMLLEALGL